MPISEMGSATRIFGFAIHVLSHHVHSVKKKRHRIIGSAMPGWAGRGGFFRAAGVICGVASARFFVETGGL
jgi:hypothetical protein